MQAVIKLDICEKRRKKIIELIFTPIIKNKII